MKKILFVHYGPFVLARGGGSKCDRQIMEIIAKDGHKCIVVIPNFGDDRDEAFAASKCNEEKGQASYDLIRVSNGCEKQGRLFRAECVKQIQTWRPDTIVVSGTDHGHIILKTVLSFQIPIIYMPRCTWDLCWGERLPYSHIGSVSLVRRCFKVYVHSDYMRNYLKNWFTVNAIKLNVPLPYADQLLKLPIRAKRCSTLVCGMVNPSLIKGVDILLELARSLPNVLFKVVPGWATTTTDLNKIAFLHNIELAESFANPCDFFEDIDILLVPSLWDEAFGCIAVESMLAGRPVLASSVGGLVEAKCGSRFLFEVNEIFHYERALDERGIPIPIVPKQDVEPWTKAITLLASDEHQYLEIAEESKLLARQYHNSCTLENIQNIIKI
ncbi:glycosyltransferase family 4 protein [Dyadobacter arcticus]|uniref:Glycosyltransferase involved in cell wall biosynthesis n=1 Tax=Dyadobacter arcticus TaxID=1078754 RepID=A0ABX0UH25_9BACT|nr:glycosyltransferase family 4 protein [Dyadobacter arcticus]NIJ52324.1 glycosyltransferase involved in cell wall biosynthesis [Dyadobacter arcticus]